MAGEVKISDATIAKEGKLDSFLRKFAERYGDITVTSGHRGKEHKLYRKGSMHSEPGKARDIRTKDLDEKIINALMKEAYEGGFTVIDERSREGAPHLHLDDRGEASMMRWDPNLKDAVKIKSLNKKAAAKKLKQEVSDKSAKKKRLEELKKQGLPYAEFERKIREEKLYE